MDKTTVTHTENQRKITMHVARGESYLLSNDIINAYIELENALKTNKENPCDALDNPEFQALFKKLVKQPPAPLEKNAQVYFERAKKLSDKGEILCAIRAAFLASLYKPSKKKYRELLSELLTQKKAEDLKTKAISLRDDGHFSQAIDVLKECAALKSKKSNLKPIVKETLRLKKEFRTKLGNGLKFLKQEKYGRAKEEIAEAVTMCPHLTKLKQLLEESDRKEKAYNYYVEGLRQYRKGANLKAAEELDAALEINPELTAAKILLQKVRHENILNSYNTSSIPKEADMKTLSDTISMLEEGIEGHISSPHFNKLYS